MASGINPLGGNGSVAAALKQAQQANRAQAAPKPSPREQTQAELARIREQSPTPRSGTEGAGFRIGSGSTSEFTSLLPEASDSPPPRDPPPSESPVDRRNQPPTESIDVIG